MSVESKQAEDNIEKLPDARAPTISQGNTVESTAPSNTLTTNTNLETTTTAPSRPRKHNYAKTMSMNSKFKGMGLKEKFKVGANKLIDINNIKNAMKTLHSVHKLRKDREIISAVRSANLGVEDEIDQINAIATEEGFLNDVYRDEELLQIEESLQKSSDNNKSSTSARERERSFGDVAYLTIAKMRRKKEEQHNKKIIDAINNAGKLSPKEREHYKNMVAVYDVMSARLKRRDEMIKEMRSHLHLDRTIRASAKSFSSSSGDNDNDNENNNNNNNKDKESTEASRKQVARVMEQVNQLQVALQGGEDNLILQLQDQLDVLHREFNRQGKAMEIMQQKMAHQINHLHEVTEMYRK